MGGDIHKLYLTWTMTDIRLSVILWGITRLVQLKVKILLTLCSAWNTTQRLTTH